MGKELKFLNRKELIEIIYQLKKSEQELQKENRVLRRELESKRITLSKAGSIADASLALTDIFSTAQAAADIYLAEIDRRRIAVEEESVLLIDEAQKKADTIIEKAMQQYDAIIVKTQNAYNRLKRYEAVIETLEEKQASYKGRE